MPAPPRWSPGYAFHSPREAPDGGHLWGVFSERFEGQVFIANVTTLRRHSDRSCVLQPGEHRDVRHPSCINYADSRFVAVDRLELLAGLRIAPPFSRDIVQRVVAGALRSDQSPARVKAQIGRAHV